MSETPGGRPNEPTKTDNASDTGGKDPRPARRAPEPASIEKPRPKKREGLLSALSGVLSFFLVVGVVGGFGVVHLLRELRKPGPSTAEKTIIIAPRSDVPEILAQLEREGVIDDPLLMNIALFVDGARSKLKPGEYLFKPNVSLREVMDTLVSGRQVMHAVTIPEGLTTEQIITKLRDNDVLAGDMREPPKEGSLLPETYKVTRGYPRAKLLAKMQEDQRRLLDRIWTKRARDLPLKTPYELVTLASIVEKETGRGDERPRVAAVFVNRLRKGMRLQSDPTIVYGLVGGRATLGRGIMRSEVERWTPYNTYAIDGLPPGPIANPGRAALEAAANPLQTQELYFVADGTGGHTFADTLEQHQRNVARWRQIEKEQKERGAGGGEIDRLDPEQTINPPQPGRNKRSDAGDAPVGRLLGDIDGAQIGRLVGIDERRDDYPRGLSFSADSSALKRLGAFLPGVRSEYAGDIGGGLRLASGKSDPDSLTRPIFTTAFAQHARAESKFVAPPLPAVARDADAPENESANADDEAGGYTTEPATYPVSAKTLAEQQARAAKLGLPPLAAGESSTGARDERALIVQTSAQQRSTAPGAPRGRTLDASEGTPLDPLRDKSWDLNSAKSVPHVTSYR